MILGEPTAIEVTCASTYKVVLVDNKDVTGYMRVVSSVNAVVSPSPVAPLALYTELMLAG